MKIINNEAGYNELIVKNSCEYDEFYLFADKLKRLINIEYSSKVDDYDSLYWEFDFEGIKMMLYYNVFLGISIYPYNGKIATLSDNNKLNSLFEFLNNGIG